MKHRFFETTEEKRVDFFFPPQNAKHEFSSHDLSFEKRKRDEKRKIFDEGSQKVKKLVFCGCLQTEEGKTYTKTTQNRRKREKEKRNEKLCVFNVGVGLA